MLYWAELPSQCLLVADISCDFTLATAKGASPLIAPHMIQGAKTTFHMDHGLVLTAYAMPMTLQWCQPQKLREKARRDCGVI